MEPPNTLLLPQEILTLEEVLARAKHGYQRLVEAGLPTTRTNGGALCRMGPPRRRCHFGSRRPARGMGRHPVANGPPQLVGRHPRDVRCPPPGRVLPAYQFPPQLGRGVTGQGTGNSTGGCSFEPESGLVTSENHPVEVFNYGSEAFFR